MLLGVARQLGLTLIGSRAIEILNWIIRLSHRDPDLIYYFCGDFSTHGESSEHG